MLWNLHFLVKLDSHKTTLSYIRDAGGRLELLLSQYFLLLFLREIEGEDRCHAARKLHLHRMRALHIETIHEKHFDRMVCRSIRYLDLADSGGWIIIDKVGTVKQNLNRHRRVLRVDDFRQLEGPHLCCRVIRTLVDSQRPQCRFKVRWLEF